MDANLLAKNEKNFFETVATHASQESRSMASKLVLHILHEIQVKSIPDEGERIIQTLLAQMDNEC